MRNPRTPPVVEPLEISTLLRSSLVFEGLEPSNLSGLEPYVDIRRFGKGETIFPYSSPCTALLIVAEGLVKVSICSSSGRQITYLLAERGEPVNLVGPFTGEPRLLAASALSDSSVAAIPRPRFLSFAYERPEVVSNVIRILGQAVDSANGRIIDMCEKPVDMRLRKVLKTLYRKFGNPIPFTSLELAELAGTTTESALRAMSALRRDGIVRSGRGRVLVLDAAELERQCEETLWI
ncbi:MAG: Crp/Fnr family transcriptional regulator [Deltaproteobacteria bacterium]|nr:Crp/Fnr family transcriptional regulator [Deltaproteobacteria bacterium]